MNIHKQSGLSLIELLVASLLGSLLILGLSQIYLTVKRSQLSQNAIASIQEKGRFIAYFLRKRIHMAGYSGCEKNKPTIRQNEAISGYKDTHDNDALIIGECLTYKKREQFIKTKYYIANTNRRNPRGQRIFSLYAKPIGGRRQELIAGVTKMKVIYGVTSKSRQGGIRYLIGSEINDWSRVNSVEISLLLSSINNVTKTPQTYFFSGKTKLALDHRLYKPWIIIVALRERDNG